MGTTSSSSRRTVIPYTTTDAEDTKSWSLSVLLCGLQSDAVDDAGEQCKLVPEVENSANLFLREFRVMLKKRGFPGILGRRPRIFRIDDQETMLRWGDDHILLSEITAVDRSANTVAITSVRRSIVIAFETDQKGRIFHDGISLVVCYADSQQRPSVLFRSSSASISEPVIDVDAVIVPNSPPDVDGSGTTTAE